MGKLNVNIGDLVVTESGKNYFFVHDCLDESTPYHQVDANTYEVVDTFPTHVFKKVTLNHKLYVGGAIIDIIDRHDLNL